ncbi:MAG: F0F1 ATP synthase subunit A [Planctomycetota bacterium]
MTPLIAAGKTPLEKVLPQYIELPGGIPISNHLVMLLVAVIIVAVLAKWMAGKINPVGKTQAADFVTRGRFAQLIETLCEFIYLFVAKPQLKHLTDKYIPYIWTIFFVTLTCNLLGLIPIPYILQLVTLPFLGIEGSYGMKFFGGTATSNLAVNVPLALVSFVAIIYIGVKETGAKHFVNHFNPLGWDDKGLLPIGIMVFFIEWLGLFIKAGVLALRLFGTMFAGHLVLYVLIDLIFQAADALGAASAYAVGVPMVILSVGIFLLEIFVAFLQAFIFTFLTTLFIAMTAVSHDHHDEHEHEAEGHGAPAAA